jgi:ketosteroid isomerase-like protein
MDDFNAGNLDAVVAQYASDAVVMPPNVPAATGTAAIRTALANEHTNLKAAGLTIKVSGTPAAGVSGDLAWMQGAYIATDATGATLDAGKFLSVHRKSGTAWPMIRDTWNSDNPPPPAPPAKGK